MAKEHPQLMLRSTAYIMCAVSLILGLFLGSLSSGGVTALPQGTAQNTEAETEAELKAHIQQARAAVEKDPASVENWIHLGNLYFDSHMGDQAIDAYKQALVLQPGNADVWTDLGSAYFMLERLPEALETFNKALAVSPTHDNAAFNKGLVLFESNDRVNEGAAVWRELLGRNPEMEIMGGAKLKDRAGQHLAEKGLRAEEGGQATLALDYYNAALSFTPTLQDALLHKAELLEKLDRKSEARPVWQALLQLKPDAKTHDDVPVKDKLAR